MGDIIVGLIEVVLDGLLEEESFLLGGDDCEGDVAGLVEVFEGDEVGVGLDLCLVEAGVDVD